MLLLIDQIIKTYKTPYTDYFQHTTLKYLKKINPSLIGFSIPYPHQLVPTLELISYIRNLINYTNFIVIGGSFIISKWEWFAKRPPLFKKFFDILVIDEGKTALLSLINEIKRGGKNFEKIPNLLLLSREDKLVKTLKHQENINQLLPPDYSCLPIKKYYSPKLNILLPVSGGCYWKKCIFCSSPSILTNAKYHEREPARIIEDMKWIKKIRYKLIYLRCGCLFQ